MKRVFLAAIGIVLILLASGCVTEQADVTGGATAVTPQAAVQDAGWKSIAEFSGDSTSTEEPFSADGDFRFIWFCEGDGDVSIFLLPVGSGIPVKRIVSKECPDSGSASVPGGSYYFKVWVEDKASWSIKVEQ